MSVVTLWEATVESLEVDIETTADPTATAPQFALSAASATAPGAWVTGAWSSTWDAATRRTTASTPTIGGAGSMEIDAGSGYRLWVKVTLGGEIAVWPVGTIKVP